LLEPGAPSAARAARVKPTLTSSDRPCSPAVIDPLRVRAEAGSTPDVKRLRSSWPGARTASRRSIFCWSARRF